MHLHIYVDTYYVDTYICRYIYIYTHMPLYVPIYVYVYMHVQVICYYTYIAAQQLLDMSKHVSWAVNKIINYSSSYLGPSRGHVSYGKIGSYMRTAMGS